MNRGFKRKRVSSESLAHRMATLWESTVERGDICSLTVLLIMNTLVSVSAAIVRWVRIEEFGLETLMMT
jgi:hypothetical protein